MGKCAEAARRIEERAQEDSKTAERITELGRERLERLQLAEDTMIARAPTIDSSSNRWAIRNHFTADELLLFDALGWDDERVRSESGRCSTVARLKAEAGTSADREVAKAELSAAEEKLAKEQPKLEERIATARRQLQSLQGAVNDSAATVEKHRHAVESLRALIPQHLVREHEKSCSALAPLRTELQEKRVRLESIETIIDLDIGQYEGWKQAHELSKTWCPELTRHNAEGGVDKSGWRAFVRRVAEEAERLRPEVTRLEAELAERQAVADEILKHYVR